MNFAFYISGKSERLKKFFTSHYISVFDKNDNIIVVSDYDIDDELRRVLKERGVDSISFDYKSLGDTNSTRNGVLSDMILDVFVERQVDYGISFGTHILSGKLLEIYKNTIINFHPAILPMYPGMHAIDQAAEHGNTFLVGNTAHFIDEGIDTGPIIMQSVIPIRSFNESQDYDVVLDLQLPMLFRILTLLKAGRIKEDAGGVLIDGADYNKSFCFPFVE